MIRKLRRAFAIALFLAAVGNQVQAAPTAIEVPDVVNIISARGYGDVDETGDVLLVIHYDVDYTVLPNELASSAVLFHYLDATTGRTSRSGNPTGFVRSGYGQGIIGIYFTAADTLLGVPINYGDVDFADVGGNPMVFGSTWGTTKLINWRTQGSTAQLTTDVEEILQLLQLETEWAGVTLIQFDSGSNVLQADGEDYLENAIPRIRQMTPALFSAVVSTPTFTERTFTNSYSDTLEATWDNSRLGNSFTALADWFGMPEIAVKTTVVLVGALVAGGMLGLMVVKNGVSQEAGAGLSVLVVTVIIGLAALQGLFSLVLLAVVGFMGLLLIASLLWLKRA